MVLSLLRGKSPTSKRPLFVSFAVWAMRAGMLSRRADFLFRRRRSILGRAVIRERKTKRIVS